MEYRPVRPNKFQVNRQLPIAWPISVLGISILLSVILTAATAHADGGDDLPVVKMTPQIRIDQLQEQSFIWRSCEQLASAEAHTPAEQRELAQRKQACLSKYQQFIPKKALK
jgi:hypothetical protein